MHVSNRIRRNPQTWGHKKLIGLGVLVLEGTSNRLLIGSEINGYVRCVNWHVGISG